MYVHIPVSQPSKCAQTSPNWELRTPAYLVKQAQPVKVEFCFSASILSIPSHINTELPGFALVCGLWFHIACCKVCTIQIKWRSLAHLRLSVRCACAAKGFSCSQLHDSVLSVFISFLRLLQLDQIGFQCGPSMADDRDSSSELCFSPSFPLNFAASPNGEPLGASAPTWVACCSTLPYTRFPPDLLSPA